MKNAFLQLCDRIATQVPEIQWTDLDSGQFETPGGLPSVDFPVVLIDFSYPSTGDITSTSQQVDISIAVRVGFPANATSPNAPTPEEIRQASLGQLGLIDKLHAALQGWETDSLSPLSRASTHLEKRTDGLKVYKIEYLSASEDIPTENA